MKFSASRFVKNAALGTMAVTASLVTALTLHFLWLSYQGRFVRRGPFAEYLQGIESGLLNACLPAIPLIVLLAALYTRLRAGSQRGFGLNAFFGGTFFILMAGLAWTSRDDAILPPLVWLVAGILAIAGCAALQASKRVDARMAQRVIYSRPSQLTLDAAVVGSTFIFAYMVRFDGYPSADRQYQLMLMMPYVVLLYLLTNYVWGVHRFLWRFISVWEAMVIGFSVATAAVVNLVVRFLVQESFQDIRVPLGVLLIHPIVAFGGLVGIRVLRRLHFRQSESQGEVSRTAATKRLLLVGAGQTGAALARELEQRTDLEVVGFVDDDRRKRRRLIHGIRVLGQTKDLARFLDEHQIDEVVLCIPRAPRSKVRKIVACCEELSVKTSTVPSIGDIILGERLAGGLKPVRMEDLLGRDSVEYQFGEDVVSQFRDRRILVTGAGGSIGSELTRQLSLLEPSELFLIDRDENALYEIGLEMREDFDFEIHEAVADIRDRARLSRLFSAWKPDVVFHAAAYKHVPMMERDPSEAIATNVLGTRNLVELCEEAAIDSFVLISTDKAVNPTSVMGASKRVAEMIVQERAFQCEATRFCCVRFGNVLGSRASVVPVFQKRIAQRKSLKITHREIRRFFMTIPEAVRLVIQASSMGQDGEIFLLDMGDPVKIVTLARELIELSGLVPERDIRIEFTGLRPGEKLYEELLVNSENGDRSTKYPKVFVAKTSRRSFPGLQLIVQQLERAVLDGDVESIYGRLEFLDIGYVCSAKDRPESAVVTGN